MPGGVGGHRSGILTAPVPIFGTLGVSNNNGLPWLHIPK